jgi:ATP-dependent RNA helicase RhlE
VLQRLPTQRQTLFFSATMPEEIRQLSRNILKTPVTVQINANAPAPTVSHALYPVPEALKRKLLLALLQQTATGKVVIFTRTKQRARTLSRELETHNYRVTQLQGNLTQNRRQRAMEGFREGRYDLLVATDIAAHSIDISEVSHVINYDIPDTVDAYTHRIGRTGRALHTGEAFTLATPDDASVVRAVERTLKTRIERRALAGFDYGDFSPEDQFPQQTPKQPRQGQLQPNGGHSDRSTLSRNGLGRPGNQPPQERDRQQGKVGNAPQRSARSAASFSHAGSDRSSGPGKNSVPTQNPGRPHAAGGTGRSRHPRSQRFSTSDRPSR